MHQLVEILPIAIFFSVYFMRGTQIDIAGIHYEFDGIYTATAALMIATCLQVALTWFFTKRLEKRMIFLFLVIMIGGGLTLTLRNNIFIQWKPTVVNWSMAIALIVSMIVGERKSLIERGMGAQIQLPTAAWGKLNKLWIVNFIVVGALNLIVAYNFSEEAWVSYKLYSAIGFTLLCSVLTVALIAPHMKESQLPSPAKPPAGESE